MNHFPLQDPLVDVIDRQYAKLTPGRLQTLREKLLELHERTGGRLNIATGCSGTDLLLLVLQRLVDKWETIFGITFTIAHLFSVDHGEVQQDFIKMHWQPTCVFEEMEDVGSLDMAFDILSGTSRPVPSCLLWASGIECDTLSVLNNNSRIADNVVAAGEGKTGKSAQATMKYVERRQPDLLLLECVKGLGSTGKSSAPGAYMKVSDLEFLIMWANKLGYITAALVLESTEYGACTSWARYYVLGYRVREADAEFCQLDKYNPGEKEPHFVFTLPAWHGTHVASLQEMKVPSSPMESFFLPVGHPGLQRWRQHPQQGSLDRADEPAKKKDDLQWQVDHCSLYQEYGLAWPPTFSDGFAAETFHLCRRKG